MHFKVNSEFAQIEIRAKSTPRTGTTALTRRVRSDCNSGIRTSGFPEFPRFCQSRNSKIFQQKIRKFLKNAVVVDDDD